MAVWSRSWSDQSWGAVVASAAAFDIAARTDASVEEGASLSSALTASEATDAESDKLTPRACMSSMARMPAVMATHTG